MNFKTKLVFNIADKKSYVIMTKAINSRENLRKAKALRKSGGTQA